MTKEAARLYLMEWLSNQISEGGYIALPINDVIILRTNTLKPENGTIEDWTFKGLICLAYDLEEKK